MTTNRTVRVRTGARLHFGPLSLRPESGRDFGGWGVMIDAPNCQVACRSAEHDAVIAAGDGQTRITKIRDELRERFGVTQPLRIEVLEQIPPHRGLGSGTQLVLAAATAMTQSLGHELPLHALAEIGQRGRRSAVGIHGFATGGLLVDAGHRSGEALGAIACRLHFPEDWRFVLLRPLGVAGLAGAGERSAFAELPPMSESLTGRLCRLVLTEVLPAAQTADYSGFAAALSEYSERIGEYFFPVQRGVFSWSVPERLLRFISTHRLGVAQSSWGPTLAVVCPSEAAAEEFRTTTRQGCAGELPLEVDIVRPRNQPADCHCSP